MILLVNWRVRINLLFPVAWYPNGTQLFCMRIKKLILCVILLVKKIGPILSNLIQLYNYITHKLKLCLTGSINSLLDQHLFFKEITSQKDLINIFRLLHLIFEIQNFQPFYMVIYWLVPIQVKILWECTKVYILT